MVHLWSVKNAMSAFGQKRHSRRKKSCLPSKADIGQRSDLMNFQSAIVWGATTSTMHPADLPTA
jgi:hypothetical protein